MCVGLVLHYVTVVQAKSPKVAPEFSPWFQNLLDFHLLVNESSVIHRLQITFLFVLVFTTALNTKARVPYSMGVFTY